MCFGTSGTDKEEIWARLSGHAALQGAERADQRSEHSVWARSTTEGRRRHLTAIQHRVHED